jgi:hypothetical protein
MAPRPLLLPEELIHGHPPARQPVRQIDDVADAGSERTPGALRLLVFGQPPENRSNGSPVRGS